jgi:hypothetical protein
MPVVDWTINPATLMALGAFSVSLWRARRDVQKARDQTTEQLDSRLDDIEKSLSLIVLRVEPLEAWYRDFEKEARKQFAWGGGKSGD